MPMIIEREILIGAPVDVVWRAITEPDQIVQWFSDKADVELKDETGGTRLRVVESGLDLLDWSKEQKDDYLADHNRGWAEHIGDLGECVSARQPS